MATPIAVLGVQQRGSGQFSSVNRIGGATRIQVGLNFSVLALTGATGTFLSTSVGPLDDQQALPLSTIAVASTTGFPASGTIYVTSSDGLQTVTYTGKTGTTFTGCVGGTGTITTGSSVCEKITGGTSAASAYVVQTLSGGGGATPTLFLNGISGTFSGGETVTGSLSGATGTLSTIGILEPAGTTNEQLFQDRVLVFRGDLYCAINKYVLKSWDDTNWTVVFTTTLSQAESLCHSGLHVFTVNNAPLLGFIWGGASSNNAVLRSTTTDGVTWSTLTLTTGSGFNAANPGGIQREIVYQNVLYVHGGGSGNLDSNIFFSWDPATDSIVFGTSSSGSGTPQRITALDYMVYQNRFLLLATDGGNGHAAIFQYVAGTWVKQIDFADTGAVSGASDPGNRGGWALFDPGDGFLYAVYYAFTNPSTGWVVRKVGITNGVFVDLGQIQSQTLSGTGIGAWPSSPSNQDTGRFFLVVDNTTTPGTPQAWLYYGANDSAGTTYLVMSWNAVTTTTIAVASDGQTLPQATINVASTAGFPSSGTLIVKTSAGYVLVTYTGTSGGNQFTGCSGGTGTINTGNVVNNAPPLSVFGSGGDVAIPIAHTKQGGGERIWGPGQPDITADLLGPAPGGILVTFGLPNTANEIAPASDGQTLPQTTINVGNTYGFPQGGGTILVAVNTSTTIAAGSNGVNLPNATINVVDTSAFPASGSILVTTSAGSFVVQYTGKTGTSFVGCTGGTGTMTTGGAVQLLNSVAYTGVTANSFTGCTGGTGTISTGNLVHATHSVGFWWSQTGELELSQATLSGTASRGTRVGNQVNQVPADGSDTTVIWNAGSSGDNITNLASTNLQPQVLS